MSVARFFFVELSGTVVVLRGTQAHHLLNVRRVKATEEVELFDGAGQIVRGRLVKAEKGLAHIEVLERYTRPHPETEVTVACAMAKGSRWNWLLEKCVELGATNIWPTIFERSVAKGTGSDEQLSKWNSRCIEAAKQCGQAYLPNISEPRGLEKILQHADDKSLHLVGSLGKSAVPILQALKKANSPKQIVLLVGPEGGLTEKEQVLAEANGYDPVFLGESILRVETAAVGLLAALRAWQDIQISKGKTS